MKGEHALEQEHNHSQLLNQMLCGAWITKGISVAAELGIADLLVESSRTAEELADATGTNTKALYRLLRALSGHGLFLEDTAGAFSLTPLSELLVSQRQDSQRALAIMMGAEFYETWEQLLYSVQTGREGFKQVFGDGFFGYMTSRPDRHQIYDAAMQGIHGVENEPISKAFDFSTVELLVDVGGGNGGLMATILNNYLNLKGVVFDLPAVVKRANEMIASHALADRCRSEDGDFFSSVPEGADCYMLRHILHDWGDDLVLKILVNCRHAMRQDGRILIIENLIPQGNEPHFGKWLDLMMLLVGGEERTEEQYRHIITKAGLVLQEVVPTTAGVSILVAAKA